MGREMLYPGTKNSRGGSSHKAAFACTRNVIDLLHLSARCSFPFLFSADPIPPGIPLGAGHCGPTYLHPCQLLEVRSSAQAEEAAPAVGVDEVVHARGTRPTDDVFYHMGKNKRVVLEELSRLELKL
eukprot:CAMPEP_0113942352 /NCGR_PEP_ID=MMETSP1339-20121228/8079_1 /TAXON_ID=94617 /ORGANISM="Fibrocapsa japonica" /LENGTH=126 /DNA_ID=CAMNT_0000946787 /DNA_START=198 /DNA_END=578 /DNA_ORIENTATION=- /assembly_acc=CAM_ASM_000762